MSQSCRHTMIVAWALLLAVVAGCTQPATTATLPPTAIVTPTQAKADVVE